MKIKHHQWSVFAFRLFQNFLKFVLDSFSETEKYFLGQVFIILSERIFQA